MDSERRPGRPPRDEFDWSHPGSRFPPPPPPPGVDARSPGIPPAGPDLGPPEPGLGPDGPPTLVLPVAPREMVEPARPPAVRPAWRVVALILVVLVAATGGILGYLADHYRGLADQNYQRADQWQAADSAQAATSRRLVGQVDTANAHIAQLNAELTSVDHQVASLQSQVAAVANQKEKALDTTSVLQRLLSAAGIVANALQSCISATNQFDNDLNRALFGGDTKVLDRLAAEANQVRQTCGGAEGANKQLQVAIQNAP